MEGIEVIDARQAQRPPEDWADLAGWDRFHAAASEPTPRFPRDLGLDLVDALREKGFRRVWFPGSGTSLAPRAFAELGFDVLCTDISAIAVARQEATAGAPLTSTARGLVDAQRASGPPTRLRVLLHDFRTALEEAPFDVIINARAIQGLALEDLHAAVRGHHASLRPGGYAIFDTLNVQGAGRDRLEGALQDAGFLVPLFETNAWHREALQATGIAFAMILGRPIALNRSTADQASLDALSGEHLARAKAEVARTRSRFDAKDARIALVVYSTG